MKSKILKPAALIELEKFWNKVEQKTNITIMDFDKLGEMLYRVQRSIEDLQKSRNNWKTKYFELKKSLKEK